MTQGTLYRSKRVQRTLAAERFGSVVWSIVVALAGIVLSVSVLALTALALYLLYLVCTT